MILKNSLLNAYSALGNSTSHIALFITLIVVVGYPGDLDLDSKAGRDCMLIYQMGLITHGLGWLSGIPMRFERFAQSVTI